MERSTQVLLLMCGYAIPIVIAIIYRIKTTIKKQKT